MIVKQTSVDLSNKAPVIDEPLAQSYTIKEGKEICLTCRYSAYSKVEIVWLRDNQPIDLNLMGLTKEFKVKSAHLAFLVPARGSFYQYSPDFKIIIDVDRTSLEIKEAHPNDSGAYSVVIRHSLGPARSTTQLFVKE